MSSIPGCGACTRKEKSEEVMVDDKEVMKRQRQKDKIEKMVRSSNPSMNKDEDLLSSKGKSGRSTTGSVTSSATKGHLERIEEEDSRANLVRDDTKDKKGMDKNTARLLRFIYKSNNVRKIQNKFRQFMKKKYNNSNSQKISSNKNDFALSVIKEENSIFKDEYMDIKFKNPEKNEKFEKSNKMKVEKSKSSNIQTSESKKTKNLMFADEKKNRNPFDSEENKDPSLRNNTNRYFQKVTNKDSSKSPIKKEEKNYFFGHKKTIDSYKSRQKSPLDEKEKILPIGGKFDMISLKADSIQGDRNQSGFYYSSKTKEYRQTVNSIKEIDRNESGVKRVNKNLLFDSPLEDSKIL